MIVEHPEPPPDYASRPACVALGFFDGVHLGHQQVIRQMLAEARAHEALGVVVTFDQHPAAVVAPQRVPLLIQTRTQRLRSLAGLGPDVIWVLSFTRVLSRLSPEQFVDFLRQHWVRLRSICVGANFRFGHRRAGDVALLRELGRRHSFSVHGLSVVGLDGNVVSSTRIRQAIAGGLLDLAAQMLGRPWSVAGTVIRGDGLGRRLGFPTANLDTAGLVLPPRGVYAGRCSLDRRTFKAVLNIGYRPTVAAAQPRLQVEAHLLDFAGDLYGREIEVVVLGKLREEQKFSSLEALRCQIEADIARVRAD
ncbi:MAG: bifunctional riboflavin kinase/FAD synthetase [Verrucomicrobiota bacterium]|nr:bifunctional riboflavin kinase/FAD synthetase [Limisphaera sp.]MDW8380570.1 bifunctional riboflavin kinase/FAD synthetase [Verrucomicrobiota bacterium]